MLKTLHKHGAAQGWMPDADAHNAPPGALLRSTNVTCDEIGAVGLRLGSNAIYTGLVGHNQATFAHTVYSTSIPNPNPNGSRFDIIGSGDRLYINGVAQSGYSFSGTGDIAVGDDAYQIFFARGTTKLKWDGVNIWNWSIRAPQAAPVASAGLNTSQTVFTLASGETGGTVTTNEGTSTFQADHAAVASGATEFTPNANGRAGATKVYATDQDMFNINTVNGGPTDLVDVYVWFSEPTVAQKVTLMFGLGTGTDPFVDDYYSGEFDLTGATTVDIKSPPSVGTEAYLASIVKSLSVITPEDVTNVRTPDDVKAILAKVGPTVGSQSQPRTDGAQNSPAWTHLTMPRSQFKRIGSTAGRDWTTVRGVKITYQGVPGATNVFRADTIKIIGGGGSVLTGTFQVAYRFVRDNGHYQELSPLGPLSNKVVLNQQPLLVQFNNVDVQSADPQTTQIWVYVWGGFLDNFYRVAVVPSQLSASPAVLDEFSKISGSMDANKERIGMSFELGWPGFYGSNPVQLVVNKSEVDILTDNVPLEPGPVNLPDNIIGIAGPWRSRMFVITDEGWLFPTTQSSPSNCCVFHTLDLRRYGDPKWIVKTVGGVYVGLTKDIIHIGGTGNENGFAIDLYPEPLNIGSPPVDECVFTDGTTILYRSADGMMVLSGQTLQPVAPGNTSLLWRGYDRHGVSALNVQTGRFRVAVYNQVMHLIVTEGAGTVPTAVYRYNFSNKLWSRATYPDPAVSMFRCKDGRLLVGTAAGTQTQLEVGNQDSGADISVDILYPHDDGNEPLTRKAPFDLLLHGDTSGQTGQLVCVADDVTQPAIAFATSAASDFFRAQAFTWPYAIHYQVGITGSFHGFVLRDVAINYRSLAQMAVSIDTGYIIPPEPSDMLWLDEVEVDVMAPAGTLYLDVYLDDVLWDTQPVTVAAAFQRTVILVPMKRGTVARRPRLLLRTSATSGVGNTGFECFRVRMRQRGSGNMVELPFSTITPTGTME